MYNLINIYNDFTSKSDLFGFSKALISLRHQTINKFIKNIKIEIILLLKDNIPDLDSDKYSNFFSRLATEDDLLKMESEKVWQITNELKEAFYSGDKCLLSFIDNKLAGYTWVHIGCRPHLISGLKINIPKEYIYNYAGFTHPDFRGHGLQPYRHHEILNMPEFSDKKGMIGYVLFDNWSSKNGQAKSGYRPIGNIMMLGSGEDVKVYISDRLKQFGINNFDAQ